MLEIPAEYETAVHGRWVEVPGEALLEAIQARFGQLPLVAENLGFITPQVEALRKKFGLPGMLVLQFAFDEEASNPYLPHHHAPDNVVYTGTHDNDTTLAWFKSLDASRQAYCVPGSPAGGHAVGADARGVRFGRNHRDSADAGRIGLRCRSSHEYPGHRLQ